MTAARRIALVTHGLEYGGGVPVICRWLRAGLEAAGEYTVDIHDLATSRADPASRRIVRPSSWRRPSLRTPRVSPVRHDHWGANAVEVEAMRYRPRPELTAAIRGYDLVQVVSGSPAWAGPVLECGPPVILQVATISAWERRSQLASAPLLPRLWRQRMAAVTARADTAALRRVTAVLVENDAMLAHVRAAGQTRTWKAPPGIDTGSFVPAPGGRAGHGHLLSVCRLADPRKGLDIMVRAYGELVARERSAPPLVLAGHGSLDPRTARLIADLGLAERVAIRSDLSAPGLLRLYQGASVFLQTSHEEGLGLSVLEAMSCGLPVVATATHGTRETVLDGVTGWLVAAEAGAMADGIRLALTGRGRQAGELGRARCVAGYDTAACLDRFIEVYDAVCPVRGNVRS